MNDQCLPVSPIAPGPPHRTRRGQLLLAVLWLAATWAHGAVGTSLPPASGLQLASVNAVVANLDGDVIFSKYDDVPVSIASITKVMTAMVVLDAGQSLDEWLSIVDWDSDLRKNAYSRLRIGSEAKRRELLQIALMSSENLATNVLASHYPGGVRAFVGAMNDKAKSLGMRDSHFVDPAGLSPENQASASDLAVMVRTAYGYPLIRQVSTVYQHRAQFRGPRYSLPYGNTNPLVASSRWDVDLSKTGYLNEAGRCLVMVAGVEGRDLVLVLLNSKGSRSPLGDAGRVRRWLATGKGGSVAPAARDYERQMARVMEQRRGGSQPSAQ